jgi:RNA polymerase sigma-70 factor (ECF subfamily)
MSEDPSAGEAPALTSEAVRLRLGQMFAAHHVSVWRSLCRRGLGAEEAADATQETFLIAASRLGDIAPESERAFLIKTARRVAHTLGRKMLRWQLEIDMDLRIADARDAGEEYADLQLLDIALSKMNSELAEAYVLHEIEGLSSPEVATLLEIPLGSVASRLRRAREQFRDAVLRIERSLQSIQRRP